MKVVSENIIDEIVQAIRNDGYVIVELDKTKHERITQVMRNELLKCDINLDTLESLHQNISPDSLNDLRIKIISILSHNNFYSEVLVSELKNIMISLVGSDLAIQKSCGLSIQFPKDKTSLLPIHSDSLVGNSPYELVVWHPLTRASRSNAMYILPLEKSLEVVKDKLMESKSLGSFFEYVKKDLVELNVEPGQMVIFCHNLFHGNRINEEGFTRVSLNTRIKNIFTPYGNKEMGSYFRKVEFSVASELGVKFDI